MVVLQLLLHVSAPAAASLSQRVYHTQMLFQVIDHHLHSFFLNVLNIHITH